MSAPLRLDDHGRDALRDVAADIIESYRGPPNAKMSRAGRELRWGTHGSLCLKLSDGVWYDHESQIGGDAIGFIQAEQHCDFLAALDIASQFVPELRQANYQPRPRPAPRPTVNDIDVEKRIA